MRPLVPLLIALVALSIPSSLRAQDERPPLDADHRRRVVEGACQLLAERYIFPEKAEACARLLMERLEGGAYDDLDADALAQQVREAEDLDAVEHALVPVL
ncbi:MAG: hypothetical protein KC442_12585, partial [Thermomicrobiales bacterium]|nr:hypothetical protein [Thermomicrobiales bacterium]